MSDQTSSFKGKIISAVILLSAVLLLVYVVNLNEQTPQTEDAYVDANRIDVVSQVQGKIAKMNVQDNQSVKAGDVLFVIDPEPYRLRLAQAQAQLASLEQQIILTQRGVNAQRFGAQGVSEGVAAAEAQLKLATATVARLEPLHAKEYVTSDQLDIANTKKIEAGIALQRARTAAQQATASISGTDALQAQLVGAQAAVASAKYDLAHTEVRAPFNGRVINLTTAAGEFSSPSKPIFTLIDTRHWYVVANFRETELQKIREGDVAQIRLMNDPKRVYSAKVHGIGFGVHAEDSARIAGMPYVPRKLNWVHVAQRFPVRLLLDNPEPATAFRIGLSASVLIDPSQQ
ncbi:multidrug transporter subunit MdtN [uncultured Deefgea sp.]|uniref:multidrug transporter subunit MdtN n=1 Tax=uncultured Deefgea sp. TaxID=1304914 RepID=UPI00262422EE|nr:multidrug transporter subunit MdtN [uncultured Deefgea sp.]